MNTVLPGCAPSLWKYVLYQTVLQMTVGKVAQGMQGRVYPVSDLDCKCDVLSSCFEFCLDFPSTVG